MAFEQTSFKSIINWMSLFCMKH